MVRTLLTVIMAVGFASATFAQLPLDGKPGEGRKQPGTGDVSVLTGLPQSTASATVFSNRRHQQRYEKILSQLDDMKPCDAGEPNPADWFVVGGAVTDKRTGRQLVRFNKVQGTELLAQELVKFLYAPRGNASIGWRIFDRMKEESEADRQLVSVQNEYSKWEAEQRIRYQQRMAKYRAQQKARNAGAGSFFQGYSRGRFCSPGGG